jgi:hypothetical protein
VREVYLTCKTCCYGVSGSGIGVYDKADLHESETGHVMEEAEEED